MKIRVSINGPFIVQGDIPLFKELIICGSDGNPTNWELAGEYPHQGNCALCRCGRSANMPFCDGSHEKAGFEGTETASKQPYFESADFIDGRGIGLHDVESLCAQAKFCHRGGNIWELAATRTDPGSIGIVIADANDCPSGRLVARDRESGEVIEPELRPSISVVEIPAAKNSGPLWVKGRIPIESSSGTLYEVRNRVTLCRCGKSRNMPFCDGNHVSAGFNDGDESLR